MLENDHMLSRGVHNINWREEAKTVSSTKTTEGIVWMKSEHFTVFFYCMTFILPHCSGCPLYVCLFFLVASSVLATHTQIYKLQCTQYAITSYDIQYILGQLIQLFTHATVRLFWLMIDDGWLDNSVICPSSHDWAVDELKVLYMRRHPFSPPPSILTAL